MKNLTLLFTMLVVLFAVIVVGCGDGKPQTHTPTPPVTPPVTPTMGDTTPQGIKLKLSSPLDNNIQEAMDTSLSKLFSDVSTRGYTQKARHSDYTINIKDDCIDRNGSMVWLERLDSYDGTEYDQDPRTGIGMVYRAEEVTLSPNRAPEFIICRDTVETMGNTTRYGAEHIILYYNNKAEYDRTAVHAASGHPIIPEL